MLPPLQIRGGVMDVPAVPGLGVELDMEQTPRGLLRVNLQGTLARHFVVPALPQFLARYPAIELHIGEGGDWLTS